VKALPLQSGKMARTPPIHFERFEYCLCLSCAHHGVREWFHASDEKNLRRLSARFRKGAVENARDFVA
jgi:hypothetical protein